MRLEPRSSAAVREEDLCRFDPQAFATTVEKVVHELNPDLPVFNIATLKSAMQMGSIFERIAATFAGSFGLIALLLAGVGTYGVVAYTTRQRTREIGVRMALGAQKGRVFRMVLRQGLQLVVVGVTLGLAFSFMLTRFLKAFLFGLGASDPLTFAIVAALLTSVALLACFLPAWRAAKVDPLVALHCE